MKGRPERPDRPPAFDDTGVREGLETLTLATGRGSGGSLRSSLIGKQFTLWNKRAA